MFNTTSQLHWNWGWGCKNDSHSPTQDFLNILYSNYFYPIIHKPSIRVTDRSATLIDNILTNSLNNVLQSGILYTILY